MGVKIWDPRCFGFELLFAGFKPLCAVQGPRKAKTHKVLQSPFRIPHKKKTAHLAAQARIQGLGNRLRIESFRSLA